jgi:hypothetical protein
MECAMAISKIIVCSLGFFAQASLAQVSLSYIPERDDAMDTSSVLVRSTQQRDVLLDQALSWLTKELPVAWKDTVVAGSARLNGRPTMKLPDRVVASSGVVKKRTLEFDMTVWFEGDSLRCAMSRFTYSHAKGSGVRSVPLTDLYRDHYRENDIRIKKGKEPRPKHGELIDLDRSLSYLVNRLANGLAD